MSALIGDCTGGPMGGESSDDTDYEVWTLHCPSNAPLSAGGLVQRFKDQIVHLGGSIPEEGAIISWNAGNWGDSQTSFRFEMPGVEGTVRVTVLIGSQSRFVVVTVDQQAL